MIDGEVESGPKWTVQKGLSGRSSESGGSWANLDGHLSQSGRSWVKEDGHSTKSARSLGINLSIKKDSPKVSNWTAQKCQTGRFESVKVDGPKVLKLAVQEYRTLNALET